MDKKPKQVSRSNVTDAWLYERFKQLMELDLVELSDDYYRDELYFKDTDALDREFQRLEEDNLFYIARI